MTDKELLDLKKEVEEAKNELAELRGQRTALNRQLKEQYGCSSLAEAEKKLKKMEEQISDLNTKIEEGLAEIDEKYPEQ